MWVPAFILCFVRRASVKQGPVKVFIENIMNYISKKALE